MYMNEFFQFKKFKINKKNRHYRIIYAPSEEYKIVLKALIPIFTKVYYENRFLDYDHAFLRGRNCVTNAEKHIKNSLVICLDIKDFFDSIKDRLLLKYIPQDLLNLVLIDQAIPQGFPTSPILANIAMIDVDLKIDMALKTIDNDAVYTRYADDLTVSFNNKTHLKSIHNAIKEILNEYGFSLNTYKYDFYNKNNERAIITGIGVSKNGIHPTRKTLKKLRAAEHQENLNSYTGLKEWSKCKPPKKPL